MPSIIKSASTASGWEISAPTADGTIVFRTSAANGTAAVDALSIAADGTPTFTAPVGAVAKAVSAIQLQTAVATTSGTSIDFTGIPAGVKRVTMMFNGVSTNSTSHWLIQLGTSAGVVVTTYVGQTYTPATLHNQMTVGFIVSNNHSAAGLHSGTVGITLLANNIWTEIGIIGADTGAIVPTYSVGRLPLGGALDRVRLTTVNGTDAFDAGSINISWEF